jgi:AmiR/NasT family two-component response regulator
MFPNSLARILIVDPDADFTLGIAAELVRCGFCVSVAHDAAQAIAAASPLPPDLLLVEAALPAASGLALAAQLRDRHSLAFMVVSAVDDTEALAQAASLGALAWLAKPATPRQVLASVTVAMARAAELRAVRESEESLERALGENRAISLATGVLMERLKVDRAQAFEALRDDARTRRERMGTVAEELLLAAELINGVCADSRSHAAHLAS